MEPTRALRGRKLYSSWTHLSNSYSCGWPWGLLKRVLYLSYQMDFSLSYLGIWSRAAFLDCPRLRTLLDATPHPCPSAFPVSSFLPLHHSIPIPHFPGRHTHPLHHWFSPASFQRSPTLRWLPIQIQFIVSFKWGDVGFSHSSPPFYLPVFFSLPTVPRSNERKAESYYHVKLH